MNICAGLFPHSDIWEEICEREGIPVLPSPADMRIDPSEVSLVIVTAPPDGSARIILEEYLRSGGAVLGYAGHLQGFAGIETHERWIEYLVPDAESIPRCGTLLDLGGKGAVPREARHWRTQEHTFAIAAGPLLGGVHVALPFDPERAIMDTRHADKSFYAQRDRLPSERVSLVSKGAVFSVLHKSFEYLHHARGLPYCHLWWYPGGSRNVFSLRVDTDGGTRESIDELSGIARDFGFGISWYLDVRSHETWLSHFNLLAGQEVGLHCYEHRPFTSYDDIFRDLSRGRRLMEGVGLRPDGVTAPFGLWQESFARAVDDLGFRYSSEFSLAYDTLPFSPMVRGSRFRALQVPIHPICVGSLLRIGYDEAAMCGYYERVIREKLARHEPLFFYHHPLHRHGQVLRYLCSRMDEEGIPPITLGEYAAWWVRRGEVSLAASVRGETLSARIASGPQPAADVMVRVTRPDGDEALIGAGMSYDLKKLPWRTTLPYLPPEDLRRIRDFDPRTVLGNVYTSMLRKRR